jgi:hypothetical protein
VQDLPEGLAVSDWTQAFGKLPMAFDWSGVDMALISAHKIGGPKGIGALILRRGLDVAARIRGGGQEMGRRSGTENLIGIAGFGAAAAAATQDIENGVWDRVDKLRNILEKTLEPRAKETIFVGQAEAASQHLVHRHAGLERRDAGDADGPGRFRDFRGVGLFIGQGPVEPGADRDGFDETRGGLVPSASRSGRRRPRRRCAPSPRPGERRMTASGRARRRPGRFGRRRTGPRTGPGGHHPRGNAAAPGDLGAARAGHPAPWRVR